MNIFIKNIKNFIIVLKKFLISFSNKKINFIQQFLQRYFFFYLKKKKTKNLNLN
jgi:hypothetical protein